MIPVEEVLFFISDEKYTRVQTAQVEALIRKPIKELVEELDMNLFWQIHRSTLVNTKAIAGVTRDLRGRQLVSVKGHPKSSRSAAATRGCSRDGPPSEGRGVEASEESGGERSRTRCPNADWPASQVGPEGDRPA